MVSKLNRNNKTEHKKIKLETNCRNFCSNRKNRNGSQIRGGGGGRIKRKF